VIYCPFVLFSGCVFCLFISLRLALFMSVFIGTQGVGFYSFFGHFVVLQFFFRVGVLFVRFASYNLGQQFKYLVDLWSRTVRYRPLICIFLV